MRAYNSELDDHGERAVGLWAYLQSGHFLEATFENWESEFLQMGLFVVLTVKLRQKGSSESKELDGDDSDEDPRQHRDDPEAPWPVRRGGWVLWLYERSLSLALLGLFIGSWAMHAFGGLKQANGERLRHGEAPWGMTDYVTSSEFWFESFQNWQSEFFSVLMIVVLSIFLRQRGSPQSKPVAASYSHTGP